MRLFFAGFIVLAVARTARAATAAAACGLFAPPEREDYPQNKKRQNDNTHHSLLTGKEA